MKQKKCARCFETKTKMKRMMKEIKRKKSFVIK